MSSYSQYRYPAQPHVHHPPVVPPAQPNHEPSPFQSQPRPRPPTTYPRRPWSYVSRISTRRDSALSHHYFNWPPNASNIEHLKEIDLTRPWMPSPELALTQVPLPNTEWDQAPVIPELERAPRREEGSKGIIGRLMRGLKDKGKRRHSMTQDKWVHEQENRPLPRQQQPQQQQQQKPQQEQRQYLRREITPAEWRAYGYWSRPCIDGMVVHNSTPLPEPTRDLTPEEMQEVVSRLRGEHGSPHPERWIPRINHPSLPPRPDLWPTPPQDARPLPAIPPSELQLNPFLRHRLTGKPPIMFDISLHELSTGLGDEPPELDDPCPGRIPFSITGPNGAQAATYPGISHMHITALADDTLASFPWPMIVRAHHDALPVTVRDVLHACIVNFREFITKAEMEALSDERTEQVWSSYWRRVGKTVAGRVTRVNDGVRRIDYLGDRVLFRGLEPAKDGVGFMIFFGPPA